MKKIYIHSGKGCWLGSKVIVVASSKEEAETLISEVLISNGLKEPLNIEEMSIKNNLVIYTDNVDYWMRTDTTILSQSLRIIVNDLIDEEGVVSGAILEAADRLDELHGDNIHLNAQNNKLKSDIERLNNKTLG